MLVHRQMGSAIVLGLFAVVSQRLPCAGQTPIDLPGAIERALARNPSLARTALAVESAFFSRQAEASAFRAQILPGGTANVTDDNTATEAGLRAARRFTWGTEVEAGTAFARERTDNEELYRGRLRLRIEQPLFRNFGPLVNTEPLVAAESHILAARRTLELARVDLVIEVVRSYLEILRLRQEARSAEDSALRMEGLLRITRALERQGRTTRIDTLRVESQLGEAHLRLEDARALQDAALRDLADLMGDPPSAVYQPEPVPQVEVSLPSPEHAVTIATSNRLDYAQALQDSADAQRSARVARRNTRPDLRLVVQYDRSGSDRKAGSATTLDDDTWFVGLVSDTDLLASRERALAGRSETDAQAAALGADVLARGIARQVYQQLDEARKAAAHLKVARKNLDVARTRKDLSARLFPLGRTDNRAVTDAEVAYLDAQRECVQAETEAILAGYQLRRVMGTLLDPPADLRLSTSRKNQGGT